MSEELKPVAIPSEWFKPGAVVPVTPETVSLLLDALRTPSPVAGEGNGEAREGCNYLAPPGSVCNKCGHVHSSRVAGEGEPSEREAFEAWLRVRESGRGYPADLWEAWQAARAASPSPAGGEPTDTERLDWLYSGARTDSNALVKLEFRMINHDYPTPAEARAAIDECMRASLPSTTTSTGERNG